MRDDVYAKTLILLMPSKVEAYGMVGLEAMCSGIPVIAHPTPGIMEALGDAAIYIDRRDHAEWIDTVRTLVTDPLAWARASAHAHARADRLNPGASLDAFADLVEEHLP